MTIKGDYILFFGEDWPSNFAPSPITVYDDFWEKGCFGDEPYFPPIVTFNTAEAYFQSRKAVMVGDKYSYYKIALAATPAETKKIARHIKLDSKKWDKVRVKEMWHTLWLKFTQNPSMMSKLLDPELDGKKFVEASPYDPFWGAGISERVLSREIDEKRYIEWFDFAHDVPHSLNTLGNLLGELRDKFIQDKNWKIVIEK